MRACYLVPIVLFSIGLSSCHNQDESDFNIWLKDEGNSQAAKRFGTYLMRKEVADVVPLGQLLRSDTQWQRCHAGPFNVPRAKDWPNIVPTLRVIRDEIQPLVGTIEAVSVFRDLAINRCINGASRSFHLTFHAIDMRPAQGISRSVLIERLCTLHSRKGKMLNMGLGIYKGTRFHIDTAGYRRWGHDHTASTSPCTSFVAPQRKNR